jgi:hypothetical protein
MKAPVLISILVCLWSAKALAQALDEGAIGQVFLDPASWDEPAFRSLWKRDEEDRSAKVSRGRWEKNQPFLGVPVDSISACFTGERLQSIGIVVLDAGSWFGYQYANVQGMTPEVARGKFDSLYAEKEGLLMAALQKEGAMPGPETVLGKRGGLELRGHVFRLGKAWARLVAYDQQLLVLSLFRTEAEARSLLALQEESGATRRPVSALDRMPRTTSSLERQQKPEVLIEGLPMLAQGNRGYCGVATLGMMGHFLGLQPGVEEYAAVNGFRYGLNTNADIREMFEEIAREAGYRAQRSSSFDIMRMKASLDQGMPVVVFRRYSDERDFIHTQYTAQLAKGGQARLPEADMDDRKSWPGKGSPNHASIINGYRDDRKEIIFTDSWGQHSRNRRMRYEEIIGTAYYVIYYSK